MQAYKTYARVESSGQLALDHLPFVPGTLVEVLVMGVERAAIERESEWARLMRTVQSLPQAQVIDDEMIAAEIDAIRRRR